MISTININFTIRKTMPLLNIPIIHQIIVGAHQTARGADETASATAQFSEQAQQLNMLVARFVLA